MPQTNISRVKVRSGSSFYHQMISQELQLIHLDNAAARQQLAFSNNGCDCSGTKVEYMLRSKARTP